MVLWLGAVAFGFKVVHDHEFTPGVMGDVSGPGAPVNGESGTHTLIVSLHSECPCSRATVEMIDRLAADRPGRLVTQAIFLDTEAAGSKPEASGLWKRLERIPGTTVSKDSTGNWGGRGSFKTSGEVRLFAPDGTLQFHGGLTESRGHAAPGGGYAVILAAVDGSAHVGHSPVQSPVFGCGLENPGAAEGARP